VGDAQDAGKEAMKFVHLGDLHLGRSLGEYDLTEDQRYILEEVLELIQRESADAVLIAGDVYDRAVPSEAATRLLDWFLNRLARAGVMTFMISGNHDSDERLNYGSGLFEASGVYVAARYDGTLYRRTLTDEYGEIDVYLLPFVKASQVRHFLPEAKADTYDEAVRSVIAGAGVDPARRNIIAAHQFVTGRSGDPGLGGSEGAGTQSVGLVEKIGCDVFDPFDYAALGHIHSPQRVGREEVRYCGSPLKYSLSEAGSDKSVPVIDIREKGNVQITLHPLKPKRDLRHLKGPMERLLASEHVTDPEDFIYITLTDENIISDAMEIIRQTYPNTVKLDYDNSHTREVEQADVSKFAEHKSFSELVSDFYSRIYGCTISEEEMAELKSAAREAGIHEAD
jgi:DNA repair protein SbcD/Mre11